MTLEDADFAFILRGYNGVVHIFPLPIDNEGHHTVS